MAKVLIVEDDVQLSEMYKIKLQHEGFEVAVANEGKIGLQLAKEMKPDIVLLDIMLIDRDYSGLSMLADLRQLPEGKDIPVIALTNLTKRDVADKAGSLGVKHYMIKAMHTPEDIVLKVKECLQATPGSETSSEVPQTPSPAQE